MHRPAVKASRAPPVLAGMRIVAIGVDERGEVDIDELKQKAEENKDKCARLPPQHPALGSTMRASAAAPPPLVLLWSLPGLEVLAPPHQQGGAACGAALVLEAASQPPWGRRATRPS